MSERTPYRWFALSVVAGVVLAACAGSDGDRAATADTTTSSPSSTTTTTTPPDVDETLELDRGAGAPTVANHVPDTAPDGAIGRPGFTRYVYVDAAGQTIPSLVEGPIGTQTRCQDPDLPCSADDLRALRASGDPIPAELELTADELDTLVDQLDSVQDAIDSFPDAAAACAAGFRPDRSQTPNMGSHFVSMDRVLDGRFVPGEPEIIMFARTDDAAPDGPLGRCEGDEWVGVDAEPVGVAYFQPFAFVGEDHFEGFAGDFDNWHVHYNLCRLTGRDLTIPPEVCAGRDGGTVGEFEPDQGPTGEASEGWMIHAWADTDHDSQLGVFSMWNPSIWPLSDPAALRDEPDDTRRGAGTEVIDDFTLPDVTLEGPGRVNFFNADGVAHNVTAGTPSDPGSTFDSGILDSRDVASIEVDEAGEVPYFCSLHPDMRGVITVG